MFSILIPLFNGVEFLKEAVESVQQQTCSQWEIIIGVNGHPPNSSVFQQAQQWEAPNIRVIDMHNLPIKGKSVALNAMVPFAKYDYIAILDADDVWFADKLEQQLPYVLQGYDVIGTKCVYFGEISGSPTIPVGDFSTFDFFKANPIINSSSVIKKELCRWTPLCEVEDYDLWIRLYKKNCRFYNVGDALVYHRIHRESMFNARGNGNKVPEMLRMHLTKYRVRVFCGFGDSHSCKNTYEQIGQTFLMKNYGPDKDIYITNDDDYTHAIILNAAMPMLTIPKKNVIGFAFEPTPYMYITHAFIAYAQKHIGRYYIGDSNNLPVPFVSGYCYQWHITPPINIPVKTRKMSIMVSNRRYAPGHKYRHTLVQAILATDYQVDIYGNGCHLYSANNNDPRIKGAFETNELYENYDFHICIENFSLPYYTSEKYTNALLCSATPVYWGATNPLFPKETITLSGNIDKDMELIRDILADPGKYKRDIQQEKIRRGVSLPLNLPSLYQDMHYVF